ncbi:hypothetical protein TDB9533_01034 [Thalassocella blandensis]|nr:hypothetical protein TDB9533_01034 [Thalassocella blandensis]
MRNAAVSLDDKYRLDTTKAYMTGIEALVRLPMLQHQRDLAAGLNTAGFISGYRGSPLGGLDQSLQKAKPYLDKHNIVFQPGINEDLAATAVWGSQQVNLFEGAKYDGVFSMWYGKGPGVDRSMDVIKHGNAFGTSKYGGVLAVAGDDHACKSSTLPHQSEHMFIGASIPVLSPSNVQEVLDLGIFGWELSRYSGCWVALKAITETMDSAISADIDPRRVQIVIPEDFKLPDVGVHGRWPSTPLEQEYILNKYRIYAARNFARVNNLNKVVIDSDKARLGIVTTGKSYMDVLQALEDLGIDQQLAGEIGLRVLKVGMSWPLEPVSTHDFAKGLEEILVVEEKRSIIEDQLTGQLYNWPVAERPRVVGEFDEFGGDLLTNLSELTPAMVARAIASRISRFHDSDTMRERLAFLQAKEMTLAKPRRGLVRAPHFCSGCPHNVSTKVPDGSRAMAGIGCHYMVTWMDRSTETFAQMGGEGVPWIGQAPFTETKHVFQNLGDGTYFHSGLLAIRAAKASGVNITYKILYNDAVAMTGGQRVDGQLTVENVVQQLQGEGIEHIAVVSDDIEKYPTDFRYLPEISFHHRDDMEAVQKEFREYKGTSVIVYDQTCAAEKRRRRKKQEMLDPPKRVFINEAVCEGCGDCGVASNCLSVLPKETELGRKREIDQSACNKDYSCLNGFCPSFVTVRGGELRKESAVSIADNEWHLPEPVLAELDKPWNVLVAGVGGTGVLTISAILAMAAYLEDKGCSSLNQTGLAQKFGAVISHVRIGKQQDDIYCARIAAGDADVLLGCDLVVADSDEALAKLHRGRSHAVVNDFEAPTAGFIKQPDLEFPSADMKETIQGELAEGRAHFVDATKVATQLMGDAIASNMFLLGYAYQKGLLPVGNEAIQRAIELNGVAVKFNKQAFLWGRRMAHDPQKILNKIEEASPSFKPLTNVDDIIAWRKNALVAYQDADYANQYIAYVDKVREFDKSLGFDAELPFTKAVAKSLYKLMAYKDEYEVARLYSDPKFLETLKSSFQGNFTLNLHLAAPLISRRDPNTGHLKKRAYPGFLLKLFPLLAKMKTLRGTRLDIFGYSSERKMEVAMIEEYKALIDSLMHELTPAKPDVELCDDKYVELVELAALAQTVRGFGHVKLKNKKLYDTRLKEKLMQYHQPVNNAEILAFEAAS